jgi:hypothetical protein
MVLLRVSLVELLCQEMMGQIPSLGYLLPGARGLLRQRPIMLGG